MDEAYESGLTIPSRRLANPWLSFFGRRTLRMIVSLWVLVSASFAMIHLVPGDPVRAAVGETAPMALVQARRHALGLDRPLLSQYWHYLWNVLHGDLGQSISTNLPVSEVIGTRLPATLQLTGTAFVIVMAVSVPLGLFMAVMTYEGRRSRLEFAFTGVSGALTAIPEFLLAVALVTVFAVVWPVLPVAGQVGPTSYVLPLISLTVPAIAALARIVRVEALGVLGLDFIRTARAKRLPARLVYLRHGLPNMLTAALTLGGMMLAGVVAGSVLIENVFAWPGIGTTIANAVTGKDYSLVQGIVLVYGAGVLIVNLCVDVLLAALDPRTRTWRAANG